MTEHNIDFMSLCLPSIAQFVDMAENLAEQKATAANAHPSAFLQESMREILKSLVDYSKLRELAIPPRKKLPPQSEPVIVPLGPLISGARSGLDKKFREDRLQGLSRCAVYIVRKGDEVLYVGATQRGARTRLRSHVSSRSRLGSAIRRDPSSRDWTVEIIPFADYQNVLWKEKELTQQLKPHFCGPPVGE